MLTVPATRQNGGVQHKHAITLSLAQDTHPNWRILDHFAVSLTPADRANGQANPAGADVLDEHVFSVLVIGLDRERVVLVPDVAVVPVVFMLCSVFGEAAAGKAGAGGCHT